MTRKINTSAKAEVKNLGLEKKISFISLNWLFYIILSLKYHIKNLVGFSLHLTKFYMINK